MEDLYDLELASPLHLEAFELGDGVFEVVDDVALFQQLGAVEGGVELGGFLFLFGGWYEHGFVGAVDLELDRHLGAGLVFFGFWVLDLVLVVQVFLVDEQV